MVISLLLQISQKSRAYIVSQEGLKGFLASFDIVKALRSVKEEGKLEDNLEEIAQ